MRLRSLQQSSGFSISMNWRCARVSTSNRQSLLATTLADRAPIALQRIKANLNDADTNTFGEGLNNEAERHAKAGRHPQMGIAAAAFVGKTKPDFSEAGNRKEPWMMTKL